MTHALIILSEVTVGIVQDAPYSVSTVGLLRMVGIFKSNISIVSALHDNGDLNDMEKKNQAHLLRMREWC